MLKISFIEPETVKESSILRHKSAGIVVMRVVPPPSMDVPDEAFVGVVLVNGSKKLGLSVGSVLWLAEAAYVPVHGTITITEE